MTSNTKFCCTGFRNAMYVDTYSAVKVPYSLGTVRLCTLGSIKGDFILNISISIYVSINCSYSLDQNNCKSCSYLRVETSPLWCKAIKLTVQGLQKPRAVLTSWRPASVSAPYSSIMTGLLKTRCHASPSSTRLSVILFNDPVFIYQPLYRLKLITSKCWPCVQSFVIGHIYVIL